jgi:hypothetical protein
MSVPTPTPLVLVTPFAADANNGNWRTAARWARLLAPAYRSLLQTPDAPVTGDGRDAAALMIALHARRSRPAIEAWTRQRPRRPLVVALTGTDLYRDIAHADTDALRSIDDADALIVLQEDALSALPERARAKAHVVFQSARSLVPCAGKSPHRLNALLVAHLREEKDPRTVFAAWRQLPLALPARLAIIGAPLDPALAAEAAALARADPRVRYLGARPHALLQRLGRRRQDEHADRIGNLPAHLRGPLPVDFQQHVASGSQLRLDRLARRSLPVAVHQCVFEEIAGGDHLLERLGAHEVVMLGVALAGPRGPRGERYRQRDRGIARQAGVDDAGFSGARRSRDDEEGSAHGLLDVLDLLAHLVDQDLQLHRGL